MYPELEGLLYQGSTLEVRNIDVTKGMKRKDFGQGFYTTSSMIQAEKFAALRARQQKRNKGIVNVYTYTANPSLWVKRFEDADISWLDFIVFNRQKGTIPAELRYDIVIGPVADDDVGVVVNSFMAGAYGNPNKLESKMIAIKLLESEKLRNQVFFGSKEAVACLCFKEAIYVTANR